jgi:SAM-dependent methyltransferase
LYDESYYRYRESRRDFRVETRLLYSLLRPDPDSRILEVGCGGGALLAFLAEKGHHATGLDISEEAVDLARRTAPACRVVRADAGVLPCEDASFDRLLSHHLVEHLADLPAALADWRRVLASGGIMAVCTPNRLYASPHIFEDPSHLHIYEGRELAEAVEKAGFKVREWFTVFPHLLKDTISVHVGVPAWRAFYRLPYFRDRGRSLLLSAVRT